MTEDTYDYEEKIVDAIVEAIKAAKLSPEQVRIFGNAFSRAFGCEPLTEKEIKSCTTKRAT